MQLWNDLTTEDFDANTGFAQISMEGIAVELMFDEEIVISRESVELFKTIINSWSQNKSAVTQISEDFVQRFLPGREVKPDELNLFLISLRYDENVPESATYFFNIAGEYDDPSYELSQFDAESSVELICKIREGNVDFSDRRISSTNDFDD